MDIRADNTIEVQLPFIKALMGTVEIVPLRVPSGDKCLEIVPIIIEYAAINNLKIAVIGSTDLTHYGPNYNFEPESSLADPVEWVRKRDNKILQAMINNQVQEILNLSRIEYSACSAGAAACTSLFASLKNNSRGKLLKYDTSLSKHEADSFVGYGSIIYEN
jgi:AmmeMemoRadiSam system protein B